MPHCKFLIYLVKDQKLHRREGATEGIERIADAGDLSRAAFDPFAPETRFGLAGLGDDIHFVL